VSGLKVKSGIGVLIEKVKNGKAEIIYTCWS
jgi:hypothetical protein